MRQWEAIHPYNAAQIMRLAGTPSIERLDATWQEMIADLGVGPTPVAVTRHLRSEDAREVHAVTEIDASTTTSLEVFITSELNRPFDPSGDAPFRAFVMRDGADGFYAGCVYQHWLADSASIRFLMREWFYRLVDPTRARRKPMRSARRGYWSRFGPIGSNWPFFETTFRTLQWAARLKKARRVERPDLSPASRFLLKRLPNDIVPVLLTRARASGATLNDLFLAVIARVCDRHVLAPPTLKRPDAALGTIIDLRNLSRNVPDDELGLFLGFTSVIVKRRAMASFDELLRTIAKQNVANRASHAAEASMLRMAVGIVAGKMMSRDKLLNWYRKRLPLAAGISNVNLNRTWMAEQHPSPLLDYIRVSPVGPIMPLVFTPSTLGDQLHFGFTYRESIVSDAAAHTIADEFANQLIQLATDAHR